MTIKDFLFFSFAFAITITLTASVEAQTKKTTSVKRPVAGQKGNLAVEAGLVFKNGDVKPAARTEFHLLDMDLELLLKDAGLDLGKYGTTYCRHYALLEYGVRKYGITKPELVVARDAIKKHIVATMTTDFNGKGQFPSVKTGKYFLVGVGGTGQQAVVWNVPTELKSGSQSITLDNENAAAIF